MTDWKEIIGNFPGISMKSFKDTLGKFLYMNILKTRQLYDESQENGPKWPEHETLYQITNPKDKGKYTFRGKKKNAKTKEMEEADITYKKFVIIAAPVKNALEFMLRLYLKECQDSFIDNKLKFDDNVMDQVLKYVKANRSDGECITPGIIALLEHNDPEPFIGKTIFNEMDKTLYDKIKGYYLDTGKNVPEKQVREIVINYVKFMQVLSVYMGSSLYEDRKSVDKKRLFSELRKLSFNVISHGCDFGQEMFDNLIMFMEESEPAKKPRTKKTTTSTTSAKKTEDSKDSKDAKDAKDAKDDKDTNGIPVGKAMEALDIDDNDWGELE
jgi:hypothetical protein